MPPFRNLVNTLSVLFGKKPVEPSRPGHKALVLSGGGSKGIFQVGALEYLLKERKERFNIICGVSSGALNAVMLAQGLEHFEKLKEIWMRQAASGLDVIRERFGLAEKVIGSVLPGGILYHRIGEISGIQDNTRLKEIIEEHTRGLRENVRKTGVQLRIGVVSLQTGRYYSLDPCRPDLAPYAAEIILASTAIPIAFPPGEFPLDGSTQWIDGGVNQSTPIEDAIEVARSEGLSLTEIVVICSGPFQIQQISRKFKGLIDIGMRVEHILSTEIDRKGFAIFQLYNALARIHNLSKKLRPRHRMELERIFTSLLSGHDEFLEKYRAVSISLIHPDPSEWSRFRRMVADRYPIGESMDFWEEFPQVLDRDSKHLHLGYEFGHYMAKRLFKGLSTG